MAKRKNSGKKGSAFEREICKSLSFWLTNGKRDDIFWRTAGSGARAETRKKVGKETAFQNGDLAFIDPIGETYLRFFFVEIKKGYNKHLDILSFVDKAGKHQILKAWLNKACKQRRPGQIIQLIVKRDLRKTFVVIESVCFVLLENQIGVYPYRSIQINDNGFDVMVLNYDEFYTWFKPEHLKRLLDIQADWILSFKQNLLGDE